MPEQTTTISRSDSIRTRLILAFVLMVLLPIVVISVVVAISGLESAQMQLASHIDLVASLKEAALNTRGATLKAELGNGLIGENTQQYIRALVQKPRGSSEYQAARAAMKGRFQQLMAQTQRFEEIFLMDQKGRVVLSTEPEQEGHAYADQAFFQRGLKGPVIHLSSIGRMKIAVARPVADESSRVLGVLASHAHLGPFSEIIRVPSGLGKTGKTYLVSSDETLLTAVPAGEPGIRVHSEGIRAALENQGKTSGVYKDFRGARVIGAYHWLPELGVIFAAEQEQAESFRPIYVLLAINTSVALAAILIAAIVSLGVTRSIAAPLADLAETATRIAAGNLDLTAEVKRKDEIGALAQAFNFMTTKLRQTMEGLRKSEEKYRSIIENAVGGIFQSTPEGRYIAVNPALTRMLGYASPEELMEAVTDISRQLYVDPERRLEFMRLLQDQGSVNLFECQVYRKAGGKIWVSLSARAVRNTDGILLYYEGVVEDISERKHVEEALRESEDRYRRLVELSPNGVSLHSEGKIVFVNTAGAKLLGAASPEDLVGRPFLDFVHYDFHEIVKTRVRECIEQDKAMPLIEEKFIRLDGSVIDVEVATVPTTFQGKHAIQVVARDITQRKRTADMLAQKTAELERSNKELEHFASIVSHDLKEPLSTIGGFAEILQERYKDTIDDKGQRALSHIVKGALRMELLIHDLLTYARVTSGGGSFKTIQCSDVLDMALSNLRASIEEHNAVITFDDLPVVRGDKMQFVQLFQNLIGNAIKYRSEKPPRIHISVKQISDFGLRITEYEATPEIRIQRSETKTGWLFSITDNGIGIAPVHFEKIFQIFNRLHSNEKYPGTGIGLAICKKIVEHHGGRLWVESEPGKGSTFYFTIPDRSA